MSDSSRLLLFTRFPEAGRCKTRLIPALGAEGATRLQRLLTEKIVVEALSVQDAGLGSLTVHHDGATSEEMASWLGPLPYVAQVQGNLGRRMEAAFDHAFAAGAPAAILFGSDIPDLDAAILGQALTSLNAAPVVIGPTLDGGYYLIGVTASSAARTLPLLFTDIAWSTPEVLPATLDRLHREKITHILLPELHDIDTPADLSLARVKGLL